MASYLKGRRSLVGIVIVMDIRHPLQPQDRKLLELIAPLGIRVHILLTKADKLGHGAAKAALLGARRSLAWLPGTSVQLFSSLVKTGVEEARSVLDQLFSGTPALEEPDRVPD